MLNGLDTGNKCLEPESRKDCFTKRQYSAISTHSLVKGSPQVIRGWLTSLQPDSHVKAGQTLGSKKERTTSETSGRKQGTQLPLLSLNSSCSKTPLISCQKASSFKSSKTCPHSVMWDGQHVYQDSTLERTLKGSVVGLRPNCPTPLAADWKGGTTSLRNGKPRLDQFRHWVKVLYGWTYPIPEHSELIMGIPQGWTELKPLEICKFQQWLRQHGAFFEEV